MGQSMDNTGFAPEVEYQVGDRAYRIRGTVSSSIPSYAVGDKVTVLYPANQPADGRIDSFMVNWLAPLLFGLGGVVFVLVGAGLWIVRNRALASQPA